MTPPTHLQRVENSDEQAAPRVTWPVSLPALRPVRLRIPTGPRDARNSRWIMLAAGMVVVALVVPPVVFYLAQLMIATAFVWLLGAALTAGNMYWYWQRTRRAALLPEVVREVMVVRAEEGRYRCRIDEDKVAGYVAHDRLLLGGAMGTLAVIAVLLIYYHGAGSLSDLVIGSWTALTPVASWVSAVVAGLIATSSMAVAYAGIDVRNSIRRSLEERVHPVLEQTNLTVEEATKNLEGTTESVKRLSGELQIEFPADYETELRRTIESHVETALEGDSSLRDDLEEIENTAGRDYNELQKAHDLYRAADTLFGQVVPEINRSGLMPLIRDLDLEYRKLFSPELKALLVQRRWKEYEQKVQAIANAMNRIRDLAEKVAAREAQREPPKQAKPEPEPPPPPPPPPSSEKPPAQETKEQRAYRILGLPNGASREHIQKAYRWLSSLWHPDRQMSRDDEKMKEINWAYDYLKKYRSPKSSSL